MEEASRSNFANIEFMAKEEERAKELKEAGIKDTSTEIDILRRKRDSGIKLTKDQTSQIEKEDEDKECNKEDDNSTKINNKCALRDKKCSIENDIFTRIKDGCAFVSISFIILITLKLLQILVYHISGNEFNKEPNVNLNSDNTPKTYNDCYYKSNSLRFILTLIESIIIFLIFAVAEAGIESLRKDHPIVEILSSWHFWEKSLKISFPIILGVQFLLEYSNWFKDHIFNNPDNKSECYVNANKKDNHVKNTDSSSKKDK
jgi:hypothetical protein